MEVIGLDMIEVKKEEESWGGEELFAFELREV